MCVPVFYSAANAVYVSPLGIGGVGHMRIYDQLAMMPRGLYNSPIVGFHFHGYMNPREPISPFPTVGSDVNGGNPSITVNNWGDVYAYNNANGNVPLKDYTYTLPDGRSAVLPGPDMEPVASMPGVGVNTCRNRWR